ncbi:hypothetical protein DPV78_000396 [Talaromyces pinophilus]|nr:hypothetical protein DPV78_000396 [Talaromyces pinophilus]
MASRGAKEASTAKATSSCFEQFTYCVRELKGAQNSHIKNRHADFKLWADSVGAAAQGQASLDWRFHDRPDDIFLVQGLLEMLEGFLRECAAAPEDEKATEEVLRKIDSTMHNLISVGVAIRQSGRKSRLHKADTSFDRDREKYLDLRTHLATVLVSRPSEGPRTLSEFDRLAKVGISPIQHRLIEANLRRRHRFMEAQRHSNLLRSPTLGVFEPPPTQQITKILATIGADSSSEHSEIQIDEPELKHLLLATVARTETMTISGTIASALETGFKGLEHTYQTGSTATRITAITANAKYPRAKISETNQFSFKCPCCCQAIPAEEAEDNQFRKHLANDICPYTCIFDNCPTPYKLFVTQKEWKEHFMHAHPPKFQCPYCNSGPLSSIAGIMSHIQLDHPGISDDELADALTESPTHVMGITKCPLCDSEGSPDSPDLIEHVLEHIHDFSLRSLPWPKDPVPHLNKAVGTFNVLVRNVNTIIQWVYNSSPENECQLQLCDMDRNQSTEEEATYNQSQVNYFDQNDYFMEESSDGRFSFQSGQSYLSRSESRQSSDSGDALQTASHRGPEYLDEGATITSASDLATQLSFTDTESASVQDAERLLHTGTSGLLNFVEAEYTRGSKRANGYLNVPGYSGSRGIAGTVGSSFSAAGTPYTASSDSRNDVSQDPTETGLRRGGRERGMKLPEDGVLNVLQVWDVRACIRCRILRMRCSGETPCRPCLGLNMRKWAGCLRSFNDMADLLKPDILAERLQFRNMARWISENTYCPPEQDEFELPLYFGFGEIFKGLYAVEYNPTTEEAQHSYIISRSDQLQINQGIPVCPVYNSHEAQRMIWHWLKQTLTSERSMRQWLKRCFPGYEVEWIQKLLLVTWEYSIKYWHERRHVQLETELDVNLLEAWMAALLVTMLSLPVTIPEQAIYNIVPHLRFKSYNYRFDNTSHVLTKAIKALLFDMYQQFVHKLTLTLQDFEKLNLEEISDSHLGHIYCIATLMIVLNCHIQTSLMDNGRISAIQQEVDSNLWGKTFEHMRGVEYAFKNTIMFVKHKYAMWLKRNTILDTELLVLQQEVQEIRRTYRDTIERHRTTELERLMRSADPFHKLNMQRVFAFFLDVIRMEESPRS